MTLRWRSSVRSRAKAMTCAIAPHARRRDDDGVLQRQPRISREAPARDASANRFRTEFDPARAAAGPDNARHQRPYFFSAVRSSSIGSARIVRPFPVVVVACSSEL